MHASQNHVLRVPKFSPSINQTNIQESYSNGLQRPFLNYYGVNFVLYELSTPFLNIHWFLDKLHRTGSRLQWLNGIALLATFAASRLVWGTYQSFWLYRDIWLALGGESGFGAWGKSTSVFGGAGAGAGTGAVRSMTEEFGFEDRNNNKQTTPSSTPLQQHAALPVPLWLAGLYLLSVTVLWALNFWWFAKMVRAVRSRFEGGDAGGEGGKGRGGDAGGSGVRGDDGGGGGGGGGGIRKRGKKE